MSHFTPGVYGRNCYTPQEVFDDGTGIRTSVAMILDLIDVDDPDFGKTASILSDMIAAGVELDAAAVAIAQKLARMASAESPAATKKKAKAADLGLPMWADAKQSIVYYIRRGPLIKIGTTTKPRSRFKELLPDEILAFEPGDRAIEALRHQQYAHLRKGGEYFAPDPALMRHITRLRKAHGDPDPGWATTANLERRTPLSSKTLNRPGSPEVGSATAIARELGLSASTVRGWAHRGQLKPISGCRPGKPLYFVDHVRQLVELAEA